MAAPAFVSIGAVAYSANPLLVAYPASIVAGNLLILVVHHKSGGTLPNSLTLPTDFFSMYEDLHDTGSSPRQRLSIAGKWASGSESGTLSVDAPNSTGAGAHGVMLQISGVGQSGGLPLIEGAAIKVENHSGSGTYTPSDVVTTGDDRLAVLVAASTDDNSVSDINVHTNWTKRLMQWNNSLANDLATGIATATRATAGTLTPGGTATAAQICQYRSWAFRPIALAQSRSQAVVAGG